MSQPICSFLVTSRNRPNDVRRLVESIAKTARKDANYEVILRVCYDDHQTIKMARELFSICVFRMLVSWPLNGYDSVGFFIQELARLACGRWSWMVGDDCELKGDPWDYHMANISDERYVIEPHWTVLNTSGYEHVPHGPFPCLPTWWLRKIAPLLNVPVDRRIEDLAKAAGMETAWLPEVQLVHHNPPEEMRKRERDDLVAATDMLTYKRPKFDRLEALALEAPQFPSTTKIAPKPINPKLRSHGKIKRFC